MKTVYYCEICGADFSDWEECREHEKLCEEKHATGFRLARDIDNALHTARANAKIVFGVCVEGGTRPYALERVVYDPLTKQIVLDVDFDDELLPKSKVVSND